MVRLDVVLGLLMLAYVCAGAYRGAHRGALRGIPVNRQSLLGAVVSNVLGSFGKGHFNSSVSGKYDATVGSLHSRGEGRLDAKGNATLGEGFDTQFKGAHTLKAGLGAVDLLNSEGRGEVNATGSIFGGIHAVGGFEGGLTPGKK